MYNYDYINDNTCQHSSTDYWVVNMYFGEMNIVVYSDLISQSIS